MPQAEQELDIYEQRKLDLYDRIDKGEISKEEASRLFRQEPQSDPMSAPGVTQENVLDGLSDGQFFEQPAENPETPTQDPVSVDQAPQTGGTEDLSPLEQQKLDIYDQLDRNEITKEQAKQKAKELEAQQPQQAQKAPEPAVQGPEDAKSILEQGELPDEEVARRDQGHVGKWGQPYGKKIHSDLKQRRMTLKSDIQQAFKGTPLGKSIEKAGIDIDKGAPFKIRSEFSWSRKNMAKILSGKGAEAMSDYIKELNTRLRSFKGYENGVVIPVPVGDDSRHLGKKGLPTGKVEPNDIVLVYKKNRSDKNEPVKLVDEYALNWKDLSADITGDLPQIAGTVAASALVPGGGLLKTMGAAALGSGGGDLLRRTINQLVLPKTQAEIKRQMSGSEIGFTAADVVAQSAPDVLLAGAFKAFEPLINKFRGVDFFHPEKRAMLDAVQRANEATKAYKKEAADSLKARLKGGEINEAEFNKAMARVDKIVDDLPGVMANQVSDSKALDKMFKQAATVDPTIDYKYAKQLQDIVSQLKSFMPGGRGLGKRSEALKKKTLAMYEHERKQLLKEAGFNPASMNKLAGTLQQAGRGAVQTLKNKESALHTNVANTADKLDITFDISKLKQVVEKVEQQGIQPDSQVHALMTKIDNLDKSDFFMTPQNERIEFGLGLVPPIAKTIKFQDLKDIRTQLIRMADEELQLAGRNTGPVKQLIKGLTDTLKNPNNPVSPASRQYLKAFNQANRVSIRKITLLKSDAYQRVFKTDSPAEIADKFGKPGILNADVLQELRASSPDAFKKYRGAVVDNHILNAADGKATERLLKWAEKYPKEYKVLIGKGGDSKRLFKAAQRMDALAESNVGRVIQKQVETGHFIREMLNSGKTQKDVQEMIRFYSRKTKSGDMPGRKLLRDGMFQDLFDQAVVTGKHGLAEVSGKKLLSTIEQYQKMGLWEILTKNEKTRMTGLETYLRLINEKSAGDFAVSLQGHELVSKIMSKQMIPAAIELKFKQRMAKILSSKKASEFIMSANRRKPLDTNRLYRAIILMDGMLEGTNHTLDEGFIEKSIRRLESLK